MVTFAHKYGLHPLVALVMIALDVGLTLPEGAEILSGVGIAFLALSFLVAAVVSIPCILVQRYAYKDNWGVAVGKGLIAGIITGVPTPILSVLTFGGGVAGIVGLVKRRNVKKKTKVQPKKPARSKKTK